MDKFGFFCFLTLLFRILAKPVGAEAAQDHLMLDDDYDQVILDPMYADIDETTVVSVLDFGAVGDGTSDDTKAFEDAWKQACSTSNAVLLVPEPNYYLVSATRFKGPCVGKLTVQIDGTIVAPGEPKDWDSKNQRVWLGFYNISKTNFQGFGIIDGSGHEWWAESCKRNKSKKCKSAPTALTIESSSNIRVTNLTIQNGQQMNFIISKCNSVRVSGVEVTAPGGSPNTDGIHVTKSKNVVIKNCIIGTGDDCISIVDGCSNIKMKNIYCGPGHGISIGSLGQGNSVGIVENVELDTAYLQNTTNGLRIKTYQGGSGHVKNVLYQNVRMDRVFNPIIIDQFYCDIKPCHNQTSAVEISGIVYRNISGTSTSTHAMAFSCSDSVPCTNIVLDNVNLRSANDSAVDTYCNSASGVEDGNVQPPADCLSPSDNGTVILQKTEARDTESSKDHIIHTEL